MVKSPATMGEERHKTITKKRIVLCAAVVLFAVVIGLLVANHDSTPMPVYQGRTAREWLVEAHGTNFSEAMIAFHEMGSNAVPFLVHELARNNTVLENLNEWLYPKLPRFIRNHLSRPLFSVYRRAFVEHCLINANSRTAVPLLLRLLTEGNEDQQLAALTVLQHFVGPGDTNLLPQLTVCLKSSYPDIPLVAARILLQLHREDLAIPALTNLVTATNLDLRVASIKTLEGADPTNETKWHDMLTNVPGWQAARQSSRPR